MDFSTRAVNSACSGLTAVALVLSGLNPGCSDPLPSPARIDKARLLALTADAPEVRAGTAVTVTAHVVDPRGHTGRAIHARWFLCAPGADPDPRTCLDSAQLVPLSAGVIGTGGERVTVEPSRIPFVPVRPDDPQRVYRVLVALCPGAPAVFDPAQRQFVCEAEAGVPEADREGIQGVRSLVVRAADSTAVLNTNPVLDRVMIDGRMVEPGIPLALARCAPVDGVASLCHRIEVRAREGSAQPLADGRHESLLLSVFVTQGRVNPVRAVASETAPLGEDGALSVQWSGIADGSDAAPPEATLWLVLRDGRGGDASTGPIAIRLAE